MFRRLCLHLFAVSCLLISPGCRPDRREPGRKDTLIVLRPADAQSMDPALIADVESQRTVDCVFEGLVRYVPVRTEVEPALAERWTVSPDGLVWTFFLRKNVIFHDHTPFDANAVKVSFERQLDPRHPFRPRGNAMYAEFALGMIRSISVVNPYEIQIRLKYPYAPFLSNLAMSSATPIVSPAALKKYGERIGEHPVGTGPFRFVSWKRGKEMRLEAFPQYWDKEYPPHIQRLLFRVESDPEQRLNAVVNGIADMASDPGAKGIEDVEKLGEVKVQYSSGMNLAYLGFRVDRKPFSDPRLREAVSFGIDRMRLVQDIYKGTAIPAKGPLPPVLFGYDPKLPEMPYDPKKAKALVKIAGHPKGLRVTLWCPTNDFRRMEMAQGIKKNLAGLGIAVDLKFMRFEEYLHALPLGNWDMFLLNWISDNGDPDNFLYILFHSSQKAGLNFFHYGNPRADKLLTMARETPKLSSRRKLYHEVQRILLSDLPCVPLNHVLDAMVVRSNVYGFRIHPTRHFYMNGVYKL